MKSNVHLQLAHPCSVAVPSCGSVPSSQEVKERRAVCVTVKGSYDYYHYGCDSFDDRGWGCGYRTLQTLCSWALKQLNMRQVKPMMNEVPSLQEIQRALVNMGDKSACFLGSKDWIGSVEISMCMDYFYDVPCKIIHISNGKELMNHLDILSQHFHEKGGPVMMGGDQDASSKGILGVHKSENSSHLLVLDPHYYGTEDESSVLIDNGYLLWKPINKFMDSSFYNLCLPQLDAI